MHLIRFSGALTLTIVATSTPLAAATPDTNAVLTHYSDLTLGQLDALQLALVSMISLALFASGVASVRIPRPLNIFPYP